MKMVDVRITNKYIPIGGGSGNQTKRMSVNKTKGGAGNVVRASNGQFASKTQTPRFKIAGAFSDDIYDRKSKRVVAYANSPAKAAQLVAILNKRA